MTPRTPGLLAIVAALLFTSLPGAAQVREDYLSREEVKRVRNEADPDKKVQLFLEFAKDRLEKLENGIGSAGKKPDEKRRELTRLFENFIRAVDDVSGHVEMWLERGGADLHKLSKRMKKEGPKFVERLTLILETNQPLRETDLRFELEDAIEATEEMVALAARIPDGMMPPRFGDADSAGAPAEAQPGKPSLRRTGEDESGRKPEEPKEKEKPPDN